MRGLLCRSKERVMVSMQEQKLTCAGVSESPREAIDVPPPVSEGGRGGHFALPAHLTLFDLRRDKVYKLPRSHVFVFESGKIGETFLGNFR